MAGTGWTFVEARALNDRVQMRESLGRTRASKTVVDLALELAV